MVSCCLLSLFHICPDVRIMAGIEASTITSEGTWRLVIPLSEFTMASAGPFAMAASMAAFTSASFAFPAILA
ncbi:hypothetical protein D3C86_1823090 [compost metagenome]